MSVTRQPLTVHAHVEPHGDGWAVVAFYSGCEAGVRFCFLDRSDLHKTLEDAVKDDGLPPLVASAALGAALDYIGSYSHD